MGCALCVVLTSGGLDLTEAAEVRLLLTLGSTSTVFIESSRSFLFLARAVCMLFTTMNGSRKSLIDRRGGGLVFT
ncbi:hypothetical protein BDV96DRAFT_144016 [Lophiotrema nucula]|uniref:Uncharacterized protein n=1 Tax=Lophiotrema nucula TaxID=690887 RepID=A0A6A5ZT12_9PLEO|nr:hypothetical protein BDV96DRAFT_144016 [Lophiotrema nucula]